ncbi:GH3 auxin-responsive promoter family protein [Polystyrenella longa]|nr:GH3 auxin-responsive promoter family protein [Polystyrenella longa]
MVGALPKAYIAREADKSFRRMKSCRKVQRRLLDELLAMHRDSHFAHAFKLNRMSTVDNFRKFFPVTNFEDYRPYIEQLKKGNLRAMLGRDSKLLMFSLSSGTTSESKFIPITDRFLKDYRRGWRIWGVRVLNEHKPLCSRSIVQLTSDYDKCRTPGGTPCGNISGLVATMQLKIVRAMYTIPPVVSKIETPETKTYTALRLALADPEVAMLTTANPSTLIHWARFAETHSEELIRDIHDGTLSVNVNAKVRGELEKQISKPQPVRARRLHKILERHGSLVPRECWPNLSVLAVWTGGSSGAFLPKVQDIYGDVPVRDHGLSASEGRMTIPIEDGISSGILDVESHYFEFIPAEEYETKDPTILEAHELEENRDYYILLTTSSGFYRYDICDVVRCTGFHGTTPLLKFLHKGAHISNVTGEKITEHQAIQAIDVAKQRLGISCEHFTLAPTWSDPPFYHVISDDLHGEQGPVSREHADRFAHEVDSQLKRLNCEYEEKRATGRLEQIRWYHIPHDAWQQFSRSRQLNVGGSFEQYKHLCLSPSLNFLQDLQKSAAEVKIREKNIIRLETMDRAAS